MINTVWKLNVVLFITGCVCGVDGLCSLEHCTDSNKCTVSKDLRSCKCARGYYGDQCNQSANIQVNCGRDSISIRALKSFFSYYKVPLASLHLPNKSCRAQKVVDNGVEYYNATVSKDKYLSCGGKVEKNMTHIVYSLTLMSSPRISGNIIREPVVKLNFKCVLPYTRKVSLKHPFFPFVSSEIVMRSEELDATIQMALYTDRSYSTAYNFAPTIELGDKVYVEVAVTEPEDMFLLRVNECWATQSPQPNVTDGYFHSLLQNGCADDETVAFLNESNRDFRNGGSSTVRYTFDMFQFTNEPNDLYLHCIVQICDLEDRRTCIPSCNSVSKREALIADHTNGLLSYGPIKLEVSDNSQSTILTTVVLPVAGVWIVGVFVAILIAVAKAGNHDISHAAK